MSWLGHGSVYIYGYLKIFSTSRGCVDAQGDLLTLLTAGGSVVADFSDLIYP